jgi:hypothetical protein
VDWLNVLDFDRAVGNVYTDIAGDWYRDPWNWGELRWLVPKYLEDFVVPRLASGEVQATVALDVPKENFAVRPAVVLDPVDRLIYQALVDRLSVRLIGDLPDWVYGWRLPAQEPKAGAYARNRDEWQRFRRHLRTANTFDDAALITDVVSFFGSIPSESLIEQIQVAGGNLVAERLGEQVASWYRTTGRGLPQRSGASAVLAHMFLRPVDDVLRTHMGPPRHFLGKELPYSRTLRWMDDVWVFGDDTLDLREIQLSIQGSLRALGLEMNVGKTDVLEGGELTKVVFEIEHSAVDAGLSESEADLLPLGELVEHLLETLETAERTSIRFATTRMRDNELYGYTEGLAERADRMPHGADHLARLFRDSGKWREMQDWYVSYATRFAQRLPWSVGQFGTMFPSAQTVDRRLSDFFLTAVASPGTALPILSVAAQRAAAWRSDEARVVLREAADRAGHPLVVRTLALAALHAGETRQVVRGRLSQHEANRIVLAMLEDTSFDKRAIPVSSDFAG